MEPREIDEMIEKLNTLYDNTTHLSDRSDIEMAAWHLRLIRGNLVRGA